MGGFYSYRTSSSRSVFSLIQPCLTIPPRLPNTTACNSQLNVTISFGSKTWPISNADMNLGPISNNPGQCLGGVFDIDAGMLGTRSGPGWIIGDTFLVGHLPFQIYISFH
jgi:cathepsin D